MVFFNDQGKVWAYYTCDGTAIPDITSEKGDPQEIKEFGANLEIKRWGKMQNKWRKKN